MHHSSLGELEAAFGLLPAIIQAVRRLRGVALTGEPLSLGVHLSSAGVLGAEFGRPFFQPSSTPNDGLVVQLSWTHLLLETSTKYQPWRAGSRIWPSSCHCRNPFWSIYLRPVANCSEGVAPRKFGAVGIFGVPAMVLIDRSWHRRTFASLLPFTKLYFGMFVPPRAVRHDVPLYLQVYMSEREKRTPELHVD